MLSGLEATLVERKVKRSKSGKITHKMPSMSIIHI